MNSISCRVCVTGAAGYIASWLINKLLDKGHIVHATVRNLGDESKVEILKKVSHGGKERSSRLLLFQADIYNPQEFEAPIQGCEFVFLVATPTPMQHNPNISKYKDTTEAAVDALGSILRFCEQSGTVRRVIYTGSVTASSPLKDDGTGYKDFVDESCWTPLHLPFAHCLDYEKSYTCSKTQSEKELLSYYNNSKEENRGIEVVSLACGQVGGDTLLPYVPMSVQVIVSPLTSDPVNYRRLKFLQALLHSVPLVHIDDVCEAHVFCMEAPSMSGRFLCVSVYSTMQEIVDYFEQNHPGQTITKEIEGGERRIQCYSQKLIDVGFQYRYGLKQILDDSVECMKRFKETCKNPCITLS